MRSQGPRASPSSWLRFAPGVEHAKEYRAEWLPSDLAAGITLGVIMVPVGLAFGELAGLPMAGLYASILPLLVYAVFGSSKQLVIGPDSSMAALIAVSVAPLAVGGDAERFARLAGAVALLMGAICVLGAVCRVGFMADFLAKPVVVGYMHGIAVIIIVGQLPKALGLHVTADQPWEQLVQIWRHLAEAHWVTFAIAASTLAVVLVLRLAAPRIPGQVVVLVATPLAVVLLGLDKHGVSVIGDIPSGIPRLQLPAVSFADVGKLLPIAFAGALVAFSDAMVTARAFASRSHDTVDANQELLALGFANAASGVARGLPLSASAARTAVAESAGRRSRLTLVFAAATVVGVLLVLTPLLRPLPHAALAGILLAAAWNLCDLGEFGRLRRFREGGFALAIVTVLGVVGIGILQGIVLGVILSLVLLVRRVAFPHDAVLGQVDGGTDFQDVERTPGAAQIPGLLIYRFSSPLFFANAARLRSRVEGLVLTSPTPIAHVIIDASGISALDLAGVEMLGELRNGLRARGVSLALADPFGPFCDALARGGLLDTLGADGLFPTVAEAVRARRLEGRSKV
jgi:high affinity sulfate transporter 1